LGGVLAGQVELQFSARAPNWSEGDDDDVVGVVVAVLGERLLRSGGVLAPVGDLEQPQEQESGPRLGASTRGPLAYHELVVIHPLRRQGRQWDCRKALGNKAAQDGSKKAASYHVVVWVCWFSETTSKVKGIIWPRTSPPDQSPFARHLLLSLVGWVIFPPITLSYESFVLCCTQVHECHGESTGTILLLG
jgi:hypothetical protein